MGEKKQVSPENCSCYLAEGVKLDGTLDLPGSFQIEGQVTGIVRSQKTVIVGAQAFIEGEIEAHTVTVAGKVSGTVTGTDRVEILPEGWIEGEVRSPCLVIQAGGVLDGNCHMRAEAQPAHSPRLVALARTTS